VRSASGRETSRASKPSSVRSKERGPIFGCMAFGVKLTALQSPLVRRLLYSADSMAWSYAARREGRNGNDWREAVVFAAKASRPSRRPVQYRLFGPLPHDP